MKYIGQVEIERTDDIYEDLETGNVYKIVSEKIYDRQKGIWNSEMYIEIYRDSMMHPNNLYVEKDPGLVEQLLTKILSSEK
jgi:hypothetical protein